MTDVVSWLSELGLSQYGEAFAQHDIEIDVLSELTESDLERIGVSLGHRKRMLKAIMAGGAPPAPPGPRSGVRGDDAATSGEYRYLTVMFCDLVGSTELTVRLGAEAMRDVNRAFQDGCRSVIHGFDGYVARYMGDGLLVYFGYPLAQEDAAERAVRSALGIVDAMAELNDSRQHGGVEFAVRIGIATGKVVIDRIGEGGSTEDSAVGEAPNMAARLQGLAEPNAIVIAADTKRLISGTFDYLDLGRSVFKGVKLPVRTWRVLGESLEENRFAAMRGTALGVFVGRDEELNLLLSRWRQATAGEGQAVLLSGEAGIGKSRLIEALLHEADERDHALFRYYCSPYHQQSALYPVIESVKREAGLAADDTPQSKLQKLDKLLAETYGFGSDTRNIFASLILPQPGIVPHPASERTPQQQLTLLQEAFTDFMMRRSAKQSTLIVVEDAHWLDPTTRSLFEALVEQAEACNIFILISTRPENSPRYICSHVTRLPLNRLGRLHVASLINDITKHSKLPAEVVEEIRKKCDGVPLYVEEITKMVMDMGSGDGLSVPDTLQASLLARLDRLGDARQITQIASAVGSGLDAPLIAALCDLDHAAIERGLDELVNHNVLSRRRSGQHKVYEFRHALLQDAAYGSLLKSSRASLHRRIADYLRGDGASEDGNLDLIAHHYSAACEHGRAFGYWLRAGCRALDSGATLEAVELLNNARECLLRGRKQAQDPQDIYALHLARGKALNAAYGAASADAHESFRLAAAAGEAIGDIELRIDAVDWEFGITFNAGMLAESIRPAQVMIDIGRKHNHRAALISGYQGMAMARFALGEFDQARDNLGFSLQYKDQQVSGVNCYPSMSLTYLSYVLFVTGNPGEARSVCDAALASARSESVRSTATALSNCCYTLQFLGDVAAIRRHAEELVALAEDKGLYIYKNRGLFFQNWANARLHRDDASLQFIVGAVDTLLAAREEIETTYLLGMIAELQIDFGQLDDADRTLDRAMALVDKNGERFYAAELYRLRARLESALGADRKQHAVELLDQAIATARAQKAVSWELRARRDKQGMTAQDGQPQ